MLSCGPHKEHKRIDVHPVFRDGAFNNPLPKRRVAIRSVARGAGAKRSNQVSWRSDVRSALLHEQMKADQRFADVSDPEFLFCAVDIIFDGTG